MTTRRSRVHQYPTHSTRSGLVRHTEGAGASLAFGAFEELTQAFVPTPSTPDPRTIRDALDAPDANEWRTAMDIEIDNMRRLSVFKTVPRSPDTNIITPWGSSSENSRTTHSLSTRLAS